MTTPFARSERSCAANAASPWAAPHHQSDAQGYFWPLTPSSTCDVPVQKWEKINLPFIKPQQFNGLRFWVLIHRRRPIAPKRGIDNFPANL